MNRRNARVKKARGLDLVANPKPWKVSYGIDYPDTVIPSVVGTSYHHTQPEALAAALEWVYAPRGKV